MKGSLGDSRSSWEVSVSVRLYVGNIAYRATAEDLHAAFAGVVPVRSVHLPVDSETGRPRGFGFVEVPTEADADAAIASLHGYPVLGRQLVVSLARPREARLDRRASPHARSAAPLRPGPRALDRPGLRPI
jgi:RNA recognition motif-containing protein